MSITLFYGGLLGLWYLALSLRVVSRRMGPQGVNLGDGGNSALMRMIRGHGNFSEYVPFILLLMGLLELRGLAPWALHALGAGLLLARVLHGTALSFTQKWMFGRFYGALITFVLLLVSALLALWKGAQGL